MLEVHSASSENSMLLSKNDPPVSAEPFSIRLWNLPEAKVGDAWK